MFQCRIFPVAAYVLAVQHLKIKYSADFVSKKKSQCSIFAQTATSNIIK